MWLRADNRPDARQAAVIDLGSNSVRLVIYRLEGRAIWTIFNEKALAGLGRDLPVTGRLSAEGVTVAMAALHRFRTLLNGWEAQDITAAATAAVRESADGQAFLRRVKAETDLDVRVLSGEEEARYAALGVLAGDPGAEGVVGDLGGSSLELVRLADGAPRDGETLALGPFALGAPRALDIDRTRRAIEAELGPVAGRFRSREFHAVGGAWRNLALLHMEMVNYPLRVAHQYEMSRGDAVEVARFVERLSKSSLESIKGLSKKRFDTLPYAALVLEALIERLGVERVVISAYGVREGLLLDAMDPQIRARDPLLEGCEALTAVRGLAQDLGMSLEAWLDPVFAQLPRLFGERDRLLISAACRLADIGARLHPDHRADIAFEEVLRAPIAGMTHAERAFLACAAFSRHSAASTPPEGATVNRLLTPERRQRARALGAAIRLGCDLSGRNPLLLPNVTLAVDKDLLQLRAKPGWEDMLLGEQTAKRAQTLAAALRLRFHAA
jgi:exopolyphosphatase/guanosine-5'-triphosphate,3'-diphosphate pyrophosphatase